ncbi:unnamed protein product [Rotaria socialis]|uniref:Tc1-like transposase DDE domain-containing protein n=1 Tax=Rotaria socialis TaxID=392032 RepID=A0A818S0M7_9BILA|nr:unnamed protein product [Rotaria socialis]
MQAHWTNQQATLFTVHIKAVKEKHHSLIIISDYLAHDVIFVHTAQSIISDDVQSIYPTVKRLNYVSDGAPQHFKNNKSILNLTYHQVDFGIPASWSFSATAHGKGAVDGIGAAVKYRATRRGLSGTTSDAILTPEDLYKFTQSDSSMNVFYMDQKRIKNHCEKYQLLNRWNRDKPEGEYFSLTTSKGKVPPLTKAPKIAWNKQKIIEWPDLHKLTYPNRAAKAELLSIAFENAPEKKYVVDEAALIYGVRILRLPVKHCSLNPIELAWAGMKAYVHENNTGFRLSDIERLASEWIAALDLPTAKSYFSHLQEHEIMCRQVDAHVEELEEQLIEDDEIQSYSDIEENEPDG